MGELEFVQVDRGVIVERHLVLVDDNYSPATAGVSLRDRVAVSSCVATVVAFMGFVGWAAS